MRMLALVIFNATVLSFFACQDASDDADPIEGDAGLSNGDSAIGAATEAERGEGIADTLACVGCHQSGDPTTVLAGADAPVAGSEAFGGNLTPDPLTGIGKWRNVQIASAIREGIAPDGRRLCAAMPRYPGIDDGDLGALVAYLQSLPPVIHTVAASVCADADSSLPPGTAEDAGSEGDSSAPVDPTSKGTPLPAPGELVISEVMDDPTGPEPNEEWFELHNVSNAPVALRGLTVVDSDSRFFQVTSAPDLAAGAFAVFARTLEGAQMTMVPAPAYIYGEEIGATSGVVLLNGDSGALSILVGTIQIDRFDYGRVPHRVSGATVERVADNDAGVLGCVAPTPWAPDAGRGTPAAPTDCDIRAKLPSR